MKFIARHLNLLGFLVLAAFAAAAAGLYFQTPGNPKSVQVRASASLARFICPMHPNVTSATRTDCPECGMKLVAIGGDKPEATDAHKSGCCSEKRVAEAAPAAMVCPHLAAQAAQAAQASACCPKSAHP